MVVIYAYDGGAPQVAFAKENSTLQLGASQFAESAPQPVVDANQPVLTVFGAAFGPANVTGKVQSLINPNSQTLSFTANDATFGDSWVGTRKSFVIAAAYTGQSPFVDIIQEGTPYGLTYRPPLQILSAYWGQKDVLDIIKANISRRHLSIAASNSVFGEGWLGVRKTLEIVSQYSAQAPVLTIAEEGNTLSLDYNSSVPPYNPPVDPRILNIIKASFGPADVTAKVATLVSGNSLNFSANDATLTDAWVGVRKAFSVTYSWGPAAVNSAVYSENSIVQISQPTIVSDQSFVSLAGMFAVGDQVQIQAGAGGFWSVSASGQILANAISAAAQIFTIGRTSADQSSIALQAPDGSYLTVASDGTLHSGGTSASAEMLIPAMQTNGNIIFGLPGVVGAPFLTVTDTGALNAAGSYITDFSTTFSVLYFATAQGQKNHISANQFDIDLGDVDPLLVQVVWDLTGGFLLAIGLGPLISQGIARPGLVNLLRSNAMVWNKITQIINAARNNPGISLGVATGVISAVYEGGLLWTVFRSICNQVKWWGIATALAKIIEWVLLPEIEAAELAASFTIWLYNTSLDIIAYNNSGAIPPLATEALVRSNPMLIEPTEVTKPGARSSSLPAAVSQLSSPA